MTRTRKSRAKAGQVAVEIVVEAGSWPPARELRRLAEPAIEAAAANAGTKLADRSEVAVVFTNDAHIRALNRRFRGKDKATNVLSFPAGPPAETLGPLLGDIVLGHETVKAEAEDRGIELAHYCTHLIVHGFLHLAGYDHGAEAEALVMERLETAILKTLGVADPYADDAGR